MLFLKKIPLMIETLFVKKKKGANLENNNNDVDVDVGDDDDTPLLSRIGTTFISITLSSTTI